MAGVLAGFYTVQNQTTYFAALGGLAIVIGLVLVAFRKPISALMGGVR